MTDAGTPEIWLVEDDDQLRRVLGRVLAAEGFEVRMFSGGLQVMAALETAFPDLLILDVNLPDADGVEICRTVRANPRLAPLPVVIITASLDIRDRYRSFVEGADDFLTKPFDSFELLLRVRNRLRRASVGPLPPRDEWLEVGSLRLDTLRSLALIGDSVIPLTPTECQVLGFLIKKRGVPASAKAILSDALGYPPGTASQELVRTHIRHLRTKLAGGLRNVIRTTPRVGYFIDVSALYGPPNKA